MHNIVCKNKSNVLIGFKGRKIFIIIWNLIDKPLRFSDLRKNIPSITDRMLSLQLKELEEEGFVERVVTEGNPPKIDYQLTDKTTGLLPALTALESYGRALVQKNANVQTAIVQPKVKEAPLSLSEDEESFFDQL